MPIPFHSIPAYIINGIVQKLGLFDFVYFSQVSRQSHEAAKIVNTRYAIEGKHASNSIEPRLFVSLQYVKNELNMNFQGLEHYFQKPFMQFFKDLPVRLNHCEICVTEVFSEELYNSLIEFLSLTNSSIYDIYFWDITCSAKELNQLVQIGSLERMTFCKRLSSSFMKIEDINNAAELVFGEFVEEAEILALRSSNFTIYSSNLTNAGANLIIKELLAGKRYIEQCTVKTNQSLRASVILPGIPMFDKITLKTDETAGIENSYTFLVTINNDNGSSFSIRKC